jgi:hypothetical protein
MIRKHRARRMVHRPKRGGWNPLLFHGALQGIKPITNGIKIAEALGIKDRIDKALDSNPVGRAVKSVGSFLQGALGYGSKMRKGMGRKRRVGRPRKRMGGSKIRRVNSRSEFSHSRRHHHRRGRGLTVI